MFAIMGIEEEESAASVNEFSVKFNNNDEVRSLPLKTRTVVTNFFYNIVLYKQPQPAI